MNEFSALAIPHPGETVTVDEWHGVIGKFNDLINTLSDGLTINNNNVGVGVLPKEKFQIGEKWAFHDGGSKYIGYNQYWGGQHDKRMTKGSSSEIRFNESGIHLRATNKDLEKDTEVMYSSSGLTISGNGNVGVGVSHPGNLLHIYSDIAKGGQAPLKVSTNWGSMEIGARNNAWAHFYTDLPKYYFNKEIRVDSGKIGSYKDDLFLTTEGNTKLVITKSGNVGIGTTAPQQKLHVEGGRIRLSNSGKNQYIDIRADGGALDIESSKELFINNNGKKVITKLLQVNQTLELVGNSEFRIGSWRIRQVGGGSQVAYLQFFRGDTLMMDIDWGGNVRAKGKFEKNAL